MIPADGPQARLHLLQGAVLYPLDIVNVDADALASTPDLAELTIDRMALP